MEHSNPFPRAPLPSHSNLDLPAELMSVAWLEVPPSVRVAHDSIGPEKGGVRRESRRRAAAYHLPCGVMASALLYFRPGSRDRHDAFAHKKA